MAGTQTFPTVPSTGGGSGSAATFSGLFGDGTDGDFTVVGGSTLTLTRERHYGNLTVQATGTVKPAGFKLCVSNTLTNAGTVNDNGTDASGTSGGGGLAARQFLNAQSGGGVNGRSTTGVGNNGIAATSNSYNNVGTLPAGGNGGAANAQAGGTGGTCTVANSKWASSLFVGRAATAGFGGGAGGASGGCDITAGGADSGGGGGGGGILWLAAKTIVNTGGFIGAGGGKGGDASSFGGGKAGGGGGGGGGLVGILTTTPVASIGGTVSAAGGLGGAGINAGGAGIAGTDGSVNIIVFA
jgi:hypothetical protein